MTGVAAYRCLAGLVAIDAPLHLDGLVRYDHRLLRNVAVASVALHICDRMFAVVEENEVRHFVNAVRGDGALCHRGMAHLALLHGGETGNVTGCRSCMAGDALHFKGCVFLVVERFRFGC